MTPLSARLTLILGAETHRLIAEDFHLDMPIETRLALLDIAERLDPREPEDR